MDNFIQNILHIGSHEDFIKGIITGIVVNFAILKVKRILRAVF